LIQINAFAVKIDDVCIMTNSKQLIEDILDKNRSHLGKDYEKYRNHVHRVFALCMLIDETKENEEKYAIASAFHDLGIWTNKTFDYLDPSMTLVSEYLWLSGNSDLIPEIKSMIAMHHKRSSYKGDFKKTVETFRRADWIDVTKGKKLFGLPRSEYVQLKNRYPLAGFHKFLLIQTLKNFLKSPLNPLPMFKK